MKAAMRSSKIFTKAFAAASLAVLPATAQAQEHKPPTTNTTESETAFSLVNRGLTTAALRQAATYKQMARAGNTAQTDAAFNYFMANYNTLRAQTRLPQGRSLDLAVTYTVNRLLRDVHFVNSQTPALVKQAILSVDNLSANTKKDFDDRDARKLAKSQFSISLHTVFTPLDRTTFTSIAPDSAGMLQAIEFHVAKSRGQSQPAPYVINSVYAGADISKVRAQLVLSNSLYTPKQAFQRAASPFIWYWRADSIRNLFQYALQTDYSRDQVPAPALSLWENLQLIRQTSPLVGAALVDFSSTANVFICYGPLHQNVLGQWQPGRGLMLLSKTRMNGSPAASLTMVHEMHHLRQTATGGSAVFHHYSIEDQQVIHLMREAGARVAAYLMAFEMRQSGNDTLWNITSEKNHLQALQAAYDQNRLNGGSHPQALEAAGLAAYKALFADPRQQWWRNAYNNDLAKEFIDRLESSYTKAPDENGPPLTSLVNNGAVSDTFNFLRGLDRKPDDTERFGSSQTHRDLFKYLHWQHLRKTLGKDHAQTQAHEQLLRANNNRYVHVSYAALVEAVRKPNQHLSVLEIIECLANPAGCVTKPPPAVPAGTAPTVAAAPVCG